MLRAQRHAHSSGNLLVADNVLWLTGNGSVSSGQLVDQFGNPISAAIAPNIWRTDWQGRQLLYPTPRTNLASQVNNAPNATVAVSNAVTPPASGITVISSTATGTAVYANLGSWPFPVSPGPISAYIWIWLPTGYASGALTVDMEGTATGTYTSAGANTSLLNQWQKVGPIYGTITGSGTLNLVLRAATLTASASPILYFIEPQIEQAVAAGAFFQTAFGVNTPGANGTVTDYTLSGTTVNLAQAPASGALCNWSGLYIP